MSRRDHDAAAYTELTPDAWHQTDEGNYYVDCPECGSAATLSNVVAHGRCNGYLDRRESDTEVDEEAMDCTARLWFELGYVSDPGEPADEAANETGSVGDDRPPGSDATVDAGPEAGTGTEAEDER